MMPALLTNSCRKDDTGEKQVPSVTTENVTSIGLTDATCGGTVNSDGGSKVIERGVCWSTGESPTISDSRTTDGSGTGKFTSLLNGLTANTRYYYRAYATNSEGTEYGEILSFVTRTSRVTDIEGNMYNSQTIGTQEWMAENLRTAKLKDGTDIPLVSDTTGWDTLSTPAYCWYENNSAVYKTTYGALYNWYVVNTGKLCPEGWHVPEDEDWFELAEYLGGLNVAGGALKEKGESYWKNPNTAATNTSGFRALPGGLRGDKGKYDYLGYLGAWWSSDESVYYQDEASLWTVNYSSGNLVYATWPKETGFSVRCLKD